MFDYFLSSIPLWAYVSVGLLVFSLLFYTFGPVLIAGWGAVPKPVKYIIYGILALFGAFAYGRHKGFKDVKAREEEKERTAVKKREEIHNAVEKLGPTDTDKQLARWMRD